MNEKTADIDLFIADDKEDQQNSALITLGGHKSARDEVRRNHVGRALCKMMAGVAEWEGTAAQLLDELKRDQPGDRRLARQTPGGLGQHLSKLTAAFSAAGCISIETERVGHNRSRMMYLKTLDQEACADIAMEVSPALARADDADKVHPDSDHLAQMLMSAIRSVVGPA